MKQIISGDGSATLFNEQYGQTYHSVHGAITEAELVYLEYSGLRDRLDQGMDSHILEFGFGLGLNFLLSARCALKTKAKLKYTALENAPITKDTFNTLNYATIEGLELLAESTSNVFGALGTETQTNLDFDEQIHLEVHRADALTMSFEDSHFDAIYLDGFSPEKNPELWSLSFLEKLFQALKPGGILSTYCVKGAVRRAFLEAGFEVNKLPGPPGKREVLAARRVAG